MIPLWMFIIVLVVGAFVVYYILGKLFKVALFVISLLVVYLALVYFIGI